MDTDKEDARPQRGHINIDFTRAMREKEKNKQTLKEAPRRKRREETTSRSIVTSRKVNFLSEGTMKMVCSSSFFFFFLPQQEIEARKK
ncbi:Uncharacterized protein APZ42_016030 [Daphnia magna]|uniref:Uncharacterized protein n=1 Tax=Daphnia magna TaxID=35525 RepID=A0A162NJC2_9CRUS|nr:Uncharacterized protein APZ42_016030 [Daphnia magna]